MSFNQVTFAHNEDLTDASLISSVKSVLSTKTAPENIAIYGGTAEDALTDKNKKQTVIDNLTKDLELIVISPWINGTLVRDRQSMRQVLTSKDALMELSNQCEFTDWQASVVLLVTASNESEFSTKIEQVETGLGLVSALPLRQSKAAKEHEKNKLNNVSFPLVNNVKNNLSGLCELSMNKALKALSVSTAVASDVDPVVMLNDFKSKRSNMYDEIKTSLSQIATQDIANAVYVSGNVAEQLNQLTPPDEQAPFCVVWAFGGNEGQLAGLKAGLSL
jgi:hypothetical protein